MKILKYKITQGHFVKGLQILTPPNSMVLSIIMLPEGPHAYVLATPDLPETEPHYFLSAPTGKQLPEWIGDARFITTLQYISAKSQGVKVDHIFEITSKQNAQIHG